MYRHQYGALAKVEMLRCRAAAKACCHGRRWMAAAAEGVTKTT